MIERLTALLDERANRFGVANDALAVVLDSRIEAARTALAASEQALACTRQGSPPDGCGRTPSAGTRPQGGETSGSRSPNTTSAVSSRIAHATFSPSASASPVFSTRRRSNPAEPSRVRKCPGGDDRGAHRRTRRGRVAVRDRPTAASAKRVISWPGQPRSWTNLRGP